MSGVLQYRECPGCGAVISGSARVCPDCGAELALVPVDDAGAAPGHSETVAEQAPPPAGSIQPQPGMPHSLYYQLNAAPVRPSMLPSPSMGGDNPARIIGCVIALLLLAAMAFGTVYMMKLTRDATDKLRRHPELRQKLAEEKGQAPEEQTGSDTQAGEQPASDEAMPGHGGAPNQGGAAGESSSGGDSSGGDSSGGDSSGGGDSLFK